MKLSRDRGRKSQWRVSYQQNNKQFRKFFKTKDAAEGFMMEQRLKQNRFGSVLDLSEEAIAEYRVAKEMAGKVSLVECVRYYLEKHARGDGKLLFDEIEIYLEGHREQWSVKHYKNADFYLGKFRDYFGEDVEVQNIEEDDIVAFIASGGWGMETKDNIRRYVRRFFQYQVEIKNLTLNPAAGIRKYKVFRGTPKYLKVDQVAAFFKSLERDRPDLVLQYALSAFAGIRPEEVRRLDLEDINWHDRQIIIRPEVAKAKKERPLPRLLEGLPETFWHFYEKYPNLSKIDSKKVRERICKENGIQWFNSALRHCFITFAVAKYQSVDKVALWSGHRSTNTLHTHYRGIVSSLEGERYFGIRPYS